MAEHITMPQLGLTMTQGKIVEWFKQEGEQIERGENLFAVETDKVTIEVESTSSGILNKIVVPAGETVAVGACVAIVGNPDSELSAMELEQRGKNGNIASSISIVSNEIANKSGLAIPSVRKFARDNHVDLSDVPGTGPGGRITRQDVENYIENRSSDAQKQPQRELSGKLVPVKGRRKLIAERMLNSSLSTASVALMVKASAQKLTEVCNALRNLVEQESGVRPTYTDFFILIVSRALKAFPELNARMIDDEIHLNDEINIGIAVDAKDGLIVPVLRAVEKKGLTEVARERRVLVEQARDGNILPDNLTGGTFTISNLGAQSIEWFTPIINYPETAILGIGGIKEEAVVVAGNVQVQPVVGLSLVFDHRVVDGAPAARFLHFIRKLVEEPYRLFL